MITVYTSITGGKDRLIEDHVRGHAKFVAFTDELKISNLYEIRQAYDKFKDPRRNSRIQKILSHQYIDTEYSIYLDGNIKLLKTPEELIGKYLKDHDLAIFAHPNRNCIYDEAMQCAKLNLDNVETIIEQAKMYEDSGYAKQKGLCECGIILRRNTPKVATFENAWWSEYTRHSRRDQISFMYAADKVGLRFNKIPEPFIIRDGIATRAESFEIVPHEHFEGNFNQTK
jgi:hypothetical protein